MFYRLLMETLTATWKSQRKERRKCASRRKRPDEVRLRVEPLEDRRLLSVSPLGLRALASTHNFNTSAITIALQNRPSTSQYGQSVLMTATVSGTTTGSAEFFDGTTELGAVALSGNGIANFVTSTLAVGTHSITAEYFASAATVANATSTAVPETVNAASTRTAVTAPGNPLVAGTSVSFTAVVSSLGMGGTSNGQGTAPTGTVAFSVADEAGGTPITGTVAVDANGVATFTPSTTLAAGTYDVTATFTSTNGDFSASSSRVLIEQVVAASAVGAGTVSAGTSTTPVSLRGGATLTIDSTQALNSTTLTESGAGVTYVDSAANVNLTSTSITSVIFSSNGYQAEITGTGNNVTTNSSGATVKTPVTFTLIVSSGSGQGYSLPSANISVTGTGISYQRSAAVSSGSISVNATTAGTTSILPSTSDGGGPGGGQGGWGGWGGGGPGGGLGGWGRGGDPGGQQWGWGGGGSGSTGTGSTGTGSTGTGSTGTRSTGTGSTGTGSTGTGSTGTGSGSTGSSGSGSTTTTASENTTSSNWSGYAVATNLNNAASGSVTAVSGTWKVPTATASSSASTAYSSVWVGIDGYNSSSVEQIGTDSDIVNGQAQYYVWYEMYPSASMNIASMTISAGDTINASVTYLTSGTHAGQFQLTITDASKSNDTFTIYQTASSVARSSAEWVVEAPSSSSGILPLANFGSVTFTNATATINGKTGAIDNTTWQDASINMVSRSAVEASTSGLTDSSGTSSFTVTYAASASTSSQSTSRSSGRWTVRQTNVATSAVPSSGRVGSAFRNESGLRSRDAFFASLGALRV